jgi:alpha-methylacyl-CoA racemase
VSGPLAGLRVLEIAGIGPGPHVAMMLADLGADVIRLERPNVVQPPAVRQDRDLVLRGRRIAIVDLKEPAGREAALTLVESVDVLLEGFRPGVMERLGLGPEDCHAVNPALVYGRMTGWGQTGDLALTAGHDINYLALSGVLDNIGRAGDRPVPPLNLVGDFGGGSLYLLVGVLAALHERSSSGLGQVVDAAIVDGVSNLAHLFWSMKANGRWENGRGSNILDGSCPYYDTYECADGRFIAVGGIEPQFFRALVETLNLEHAIPDQEDRDEWPRMRQLFAAAFAEKSRDEWDSIFRKVDACVSPVLTLDEVADDPHMRHRGVIYESGGFPQASAAPRFSRSLLDKSAAPQHVSLAELLSGRRQGSATQESLPANPSRITPRVTSAKGWVVVGGENPCGSR